MSISRPIGSMRVQLCPTHVRSSFEVLCQRLAYPSILPELVLYSIKVTLLCLDLYEALIALGDITLYLLLTH